MLAEMFLAVDDAAGLYSLAGGVDRQQLEEVYRAFVLGGLERCGRRVTS